MIKIFRFLFISLTILSSVDARAKLDFKSGDVLLVSLNCYTCALIERSTNGPYSHSGLIIKRGKQVYVAQALGPVHMLELSTFLAQTKPGTLVAHLRPQNSFSLNDIERAYAHFEGTPFDRDYLWDDEKLYCSEFIAKFFNFLRPGSLFPSPIEYGEDDEIWRNLLGSRYNGGELGNSPVSLLHDPFFKLMGTFGPR